MFIVEFEKFSKSTCLPAESKAHKNCSSSFVDFEQVFTHRIVYLPISRQCSISIPPKLIGMNIAVKWVKQIALWSQYSILIQLKKMHGANTLIKT